MPDNLCLWIIHFQSSYQYSQRVPLPFRPCVFCYPVTIQTTFIANTN